MSYQWDDIAREWSLVSSGPYSREEVVEAFNALSELKGRAWLEQQRVRPSTGTTAQAAVQVVELWRLCRRLVDQPDLGPILSHLSAAGGLAPSAAAVLRLAAHAAGAGAQVALEDSDDSPGLKLQLGAALVECRAANASLAALQRHLYELAQAIGAAVVRVSAPRHIELLLCREPTTHEAGVLKATAIRLGRSERQPQERHFPGLGSLFSGPFGSERLAGWAPAIFEPRPRVEAAVFHSAPDATGRACARRFTVQVPFAPEQVWDLLEGEEAWFLPTQPGLLLFDVSDLPGDLQAWRYLLSLCLQVGGLPGIGGVLLLQVQHHSGGVRVERALLPGASDALPLPAELRRLLEGFGEPHVPRRH